MDAHHPTPFDAFVGALLDSGCELATVLAHMEAFRAAGPPDRDTPEIRDVLHGLLCEVLQPAFEQFGDAGLRTATRALTLASTTVCNDLLLVPPAPARCKTGTRRRRR